MIVYSHYTAIIQINYDYGICDLTVLLVCTPNLSIVGKIMIPIDYPSIVSAL